MQFSKSMTTESPSNHHNLELQSTRELLKGINGEDQQVAHAVKAVIPAIEALVDAILPAMRIGGRLFYIGAGTSGRLGIVDASECPPTFGVDHGVVVGLMAGGDQAIRKAVEDAEDDDQLAWQDLTAHGIGPNDCLIGIAASGRTPYVIGGLKQAREAGLVTGAIVCNVDSKVAATAAYPIEAIVGPEFITGSTRMKAGTAQKLILNMISSSLMIQMGHVEGNKMVDMQLSNAKLIERGTAMVMESTQLQQKEAKALLLKMGSVRKAVEAYRNS